MRRFNSRLGGNGLEGGEAGVTVSAARQVAVVKVPLTETAFTRR